MTTPHYLSLRENWQNAANAAGAKLEDVVFGTVLAHLDAKYPGQYAVKTHPKDLDLLWLDDKRRRDPSFFAVKPAEPKDGDIWYDETDRMFKTQEKGRSKRSRCGCEPDLGITHLATGRKYFVECKQQNDAGNAHERAAKYATPSSIAAIQRCIGGVGYHPIGYLFSGSMVTNMKYILEIEATYSFAAEHLLLWRPERPVDALCEWIDRTVVPILTSP